MRSKLFITSSPHSTVDFVDWLGLGWGGCFLLSFSVFFVAPVDNLCILPVYFGILFWRFSFTIFSFLPIKKYIKYILHIFYALFP